MDLSKDKACDACKELVGPADPQIARTEAPQSLRARFGTDSLRCAVYFSDSPARAVFDSAFFFSRVNAGTASKFPSLANLALVERKTLFKDTLIAEAEQDAQEAAANAADLRLRASTEQVLYAVFFYLFHPNPRISLQVFALLKKCTGQDYDRSQIRSHLEHNADFAREAQLYHVESVLAYAEKHNFNTIMNWSSPSSAVNPESTSSSSSEATERRPGANAACRDSAFTHTGNFRP